MMRKSTTAKAPNLLTKNDIGESEFKKLSENNRITNLITLDSSRKELVNNGVPENKLIYIVQLVSTTSGVWFTDYNDAQTLINSQVTFEHVFLPEKKVYKAMAMDGRNLDAVFLALEQSFKDDESGWMELKNEMGAGACAIKPVKSLFGKLVMLKR